MAGVVAYHVACTENTHHIGEPAGAISARKPVNVLLLPWTSACRNCTFERTDIVEQLRLIDFVTTGPNNFHDVRCVL